MSPFLPVLLLTAALSCAFVLNLSARPAIIKRITAVAFVITGAGSLLVYSYGFAATTESLTLAVLHAATATLHSFLGGDEFSAISAAPFLTTVLGQVLFWLLHMIAMYVTASTVLVTVGAGILRRLRMMFSLRGELVLIYGSHEGALAFGRRMTQRSRTSVVFVDPSASSSAADAIRHMGALLRQDSAAAEPDRRFLRSAGIRSNRKISLYALSRDSGANAQFATRLLQAMEKAEIPSARTSLTMLGHEDSLESAFMATPTSYGYGSVTMLDEAELAARLLIRNAPPVRALTFDKNGVAQENLHCLIVGFGSVGQAVLRNVIISGQFVGSTFRAAVFAPDCSNVSGLMHSQSPGLWENYDIFLIDADGRSRCMYEYLSAEGSGVNYVAVCTGSDTLNKEIADELAQFFSRRGRSVPIQLCSHSGVQQLRQNAKSLHWPLYSAEVLCGDILDKKAKLLNHIYCKNKLTEDENWENCNYANRLSSRAAADFSPAFLHMAGLTAEDVKKNGWHPSGDLLTNLAHTEHLRWCAFQYSRGFSLMDRKTHMAQAKAYADDVEANGESTLPISKNNARRLHACLVPWKDLPALDEAENAVTGGNVNYQDKDRDNVLLLDRLLKLDKEPV